MKQQTLAQITASIGNIDRTAARFRIGVVSDVDPLTVTLGGAATPYAGVKSIATDLAVDDRVGVLMLRNDLLVLGRIGSGSGDAGGAVDGSTGAKIRGRGFTSTRTGAGLYTITFDVARSEHPSPTFGLFANGLAMGISCYGTSTSDMNVSTYRSDTAAATDCSFSFSA